MITRSSLTESFADPVDLEAKRGRSTAVKIISVLAAVAVTAALLIGLLIWRKRHKERVTTEKAVHTTPVRAALPAEVQVFMDQPVRKGPQAVVGGTVQNISGESLSNMS